MRSLNSSGIGYTVVTLYLHCMDYKVQHWGVFYEILDLI